MVTVGDELYVCNLCGQEGYGRTGRHTIPTAVREGLGRLAPKFTRHFGQIYIPYGMGCGLGGGDWDVVSRIIWETIPDAIICKLEE